MNFKVNRKIENRVFSVQIKFDGLGSDTLTPEEEAKLVAELGFPEVDLGGSFAGKFEVNAAGIVEAKEDGADVNFLVNSKKAHLKEGFVALHQVALDSIKENNVDATHLPTKEKVAEAQCLLFETIVAGRIQKSVDALQAKVSTFQDGYPKDLIV